MTDASTIETIETEEKGNALAVLGGISLPDLFGADYDFKGLVGKIRQEVTAEAPDLTTAKGRARITSTAYKVTQSKTALDKAALKLTEDMRAKVSAVNAERKLIKEELDALRDEIKKPLLEYEAKEKARTDALQERMTAFDQSICKPSDTSQFIKEHLVRVQETPIDESWEEFETLADEAKQATMQAWAEMYEFAKAREIEQERRDREQEEARAELEQLRAEKAEREKADALAAAKKAEAERAEAAQKRAEAAAALAKEKAEQEAKDRLEAAALEAQRREEALKQELAAAAERERVAEERERERIEAEKAQQQQKEIERAEFQKYRAQILAEIQSAIKPIPKAQIAQAIMDGKLPHVSVDN